MNKETMSLCAVLVCVHALAQETCFERPGVKADRAARQVVVKARATGLPKGDPLEFILISKSSGHDYESLAISEAQPSDIHAALEFIGIRPGRPARGMNFWPKGERVIIHFAWDPAHSSQPPDAMPDALQPDATLTNVRVESITIDLRNNQNYPPDGFTFVGSYLTKTAEFSNQQVYAADVLEPNSIISTFNTAGTVLDIPRQGDQNELYGAIACNPAYLFKKGQPLNVIMTPEPRPDGSPRVKDLIIAAEPLPDKTGATLDEMAIRLLDADGNLLNPDNLTMTGVLSKLNTLKNHDLHTALRIDEKLALGGIRAFCRIVRDIEGERGIRVEAPRENRLYYQAFLPNPSFVDREKRNSHPWELYLEPGNGTLTGRVEFIERYWKEEADDYKTDLYSYPISAPKDLETLLEPPKDIKRKGPGLSVLLAFTPATLTYGQVLAFLKPVMDSHPLMYIILPDGGRDAGDQNP